MGELRLSTMAIPGLSALLGGVVGALLTVALTRPKVTAESRPRPEPVAETVAPTGTPLDGRVAALERSLQSLALKESIARATAQAASAQAVDAQKPPVADVAPIVDNPVFEAAVRDVMDRQEQERNLERESQRAEWRKRTAEEWGTQLGEKLRLTEMQKAKVIEVANTFWEKLRDLRQGDAQPSSREQWREQVEALRKSADADLAKVLDPSQLTSYRELDEASRLGSPRSLRASQRAGRRAE